MEWSGVESKPEALIPTFGPTRRYLVRDFYKQQTAEEEGGVPTWATLLLALYTAGYFALIGSLIVDCQKAGVRKSLSNTDLSGHVVSGIETTKYTQLPVDIKKTQLNV